MASVVFILSVAVAWHIGYKAAVVRMVVLRNNPYPTKSSSASHPDYYGDPWTEGLTAENKENRIDTV